MSLLGWDDTKKLKLTIDSSKVDEDLTDFPVLITLSSGCGISGFDASCVFDEVYAYPYEVCDDFTGADGCLPDTNLWRTVNSSYIDIYNNKLRFADNNNFSCVDSEFSLSGDFNIQVDFELINGPSTNSWSAGLVVYFNNNFDKFIVRRAYCGAHCYWALECINGVWNDIGSKYNSTDTSGKLCITRIGNIFTGYFLLDGYWYKLGSKTYDIAQKDVRFVRLEHGPWDNNPSFSFYFDNFKVNNGTPYFPSRLAITATVSGVETQCYSEIERWEQENNKAILWTKIPTVISGSYTMLDLYYDKSHLNNWDYVDFVGTSAGKAVWDSNFIGVYHFEDLSGNVKDSTSNMNHGTAHGLSITERSVSGLIGNAFDFNGSEYIELPDNNDFKPDYVTIEAICRTDSGNPDWARIFDRYHHPDYGYALIITNEGKARFHPRITGNVYSDADTAAVVEGDGDWHYLAGSYGSTKTKMYDGGNCDEIEITSSGVIIHEVTQEPRIGDGVYDSSYLGQICEIRVSNIARSASWIKATYHSNWDTLLTYSDEEKHIKGYFSGYTFEQNNPVSRKLYLHNRLTGELITTTTSSGNGYYYMETVSSGSHYIVCLDDDAGVEYNDLIIGPAFPTTISG